MGFQQRSTINPCDVEAIEQWGVLLRLLSKGARHLSIHVCGYLGAFASFLKGLQ